MKPKIKPFLMIQACAVYTIATPYIPDGMGWRIAWAALVGLMMIGIISVIVDFTKPAKKSERELRTERIRELEAELGFTPLELGDPTESEAEPVNRIRYEKE